jgi:BirA family transcriptional regulator, biotin operon repressor / biotin---[acetyl-CoA-carboxylase] ligase
MPLAIAFRIETFETLPSTQSEARRRLEHGEDVAGLVVRAARQTQGRGRRERRWESAAGGSYQTLVVRDPAPPSLGRGGSAIAVAVGLAETLAGYGVRAAVKWPNDLHYRERKLGGILTEYLRGHLLVGVGINVGNEPPPGATALRGWDLEGVHGVVLEGIQRGLDAWLADESALPERFAPYDALLGRTVSAESGGTVVTGEALGVDARGCLLLATARGRVSVCSGSVRVVPAPPDP